MFNPWHHLDPDTEVHFDSLPAGVAGYTDGETITLSNRLTQRGRRCTLTHELLHVLRGVNPYPHDWYDMREERAIDECSARLLVPLHRLVDVARWTCNLAEAAEELWVDTATLRDRIRTLTDRERQHLRNHLEGEWQP